jgi:hypothetical protein
MTAARKPNDMIAMMAVTVPVSSIGSSFPIEGPLLAVPNSVEGPLLRRQDESLLHCNKAFSLKTEELNAFRPKGFTGRRRRFFAKQGKVSNADYEGVNEAYCVPKLVLRADRETNNHAAQCCRYGNTIRARF